MDVTVRWLASDSLLREELVREGVGNPQKRAFSLDVGTMTPVERQAVLALAGMSLSYKGVASLGDIDLGQRYQVPRVHGGEKDYLGKWYEREDVRLDHRPELAEVLTLGGELKRLEDEALAFQEAKEAEAREAKRVLEVAVDCERAAIDALEVAGDVAALDTWQPSVVSREEASHYGLYERSHKAWSGLKAKAADADKARWIDAHGSAHLKRAAAEGYDCRRLYVLERAAIEAPELIVDFYNGAEWRERACPTVAALDALEEARVLELGEPLIVWLTSGPRPSKVEEYDEPVEFEPCEALVLRGYLGRYDLVKII